MVIPVCAWHLSNLSTQQFGLHGPHCATCLYDARGMTMCRKPMKAALCNWQHLTLKSPSSSWGTLKEPGTRFAGEGALMMRGSQEHWTCHWWWFDLKQFPRSNMLNGNWVLGVLSFPGRVFFSVLVGIRLYQNRFHRSRMREMIDPSCLRVENEVHFVDGFPWQQPNYVDYVPKGTHL